MNSKVHVPMLGSRYDQGLRYDQDSRFGAVDGGSVNAFLAAALTRVMRAAVSIPAVASASVLHSAAVVGSVVGIVRPL